MMLALIFLINLTEQWDGNKEAIVQSKNLPVSQGIKFHSLHLC